MKRMQRYQMSFLSVLFYRALVISLLASSQISATKLYRHVTGLVQLQPESNLGKSGGLPASTAPLNGSSRSRSGLSRLLPFSAGRETR
jgi:hypothetical protein